MRWTDRLCEFWWSNAPVGLGRLSGTLGSAARDGSYLTAWPAIGAIAPPIVFVIGWYLGADRIGYDWPNAVHYLYSPATMLLLVMISGHGAALGLAAWLGFALGDLSLFVPFASIFDGVAAARLLADAVLALLVVTIPLGIIRISRAVDLAVPRIVSQFSNGKDGKLAANLKLPVNVVARAVTAFVLVFLWMESAPLLLQAVTKWPGGSPMTHALVQTMRHVGLLPSIAAAYVAATRYFLETAAARQKPAGVRSFQNGRRAGAFPARAIASTVARAAFMTLLMGSLFASWTQAISFFVIFLLIFVARRFASRLIPAWPGRLMRIPPVVRAGAAVLLLYGTVRSIADATASQDNTFLPALAIVAIALVVFPIAMPDRRAALKSATTVAGAVVAVAFIAIVASVTATYAGNCTSGPNCFGPGWTEVAYFGTSVLAALVAQDDPPSAISIIQPDDLTIQLCGRDIQFTAETVPPGREGEITWEVPSGQDETTSSGAGPTFSTSWTSTGIKQVVARIDDVADDVLVVAFKTDEESNSSLGDLIGSELPARERGPHDYTWYRQHELDDDATPVEP